MDAQTIAVAQAPARSTRLREIVNNNLLLIMLVVLAIAAHLLSHGAFLTPRNIINVLAQNSVLGVLAVGQTLIILTAGIDLSLGSITSLSAVMMLTFQGYGFFPSLLIGIGVGALAGMVNGMLVSWGRVPPFIATLGMMQVAMGLAYVVSQGFSVDDHNHVGLLFGQDKLFNLIPSVVIVWALVALIALFIARRTRYGSYIYAVGGNQRAARIGGVPINRVLIFVYSFAGVCAAIGALLYINRYGNAEPSIGNIASLSMSMAPVVVGGTSLFGGTGGVGKTIIGVLILGVLTNIMTLIGVPANPQAAVQGAIILIVVFMFVRQERLRKIR